MNVLQSILFCLLPSKVKVFVLRRLGHDIGQNVSIGFSVFIGIKQISMGDNSRIGHFNVFKHVPELRLGERATIGRHNVFSTNQVKYICPDNICSPALIVGAYSAITNRHYFDIQAAVILGAYTLIGGIGTIIFSHQKGLKHLNEAKPIAIGSHVMIGARSILLPGTVIADYIIVSAGSVISGSLDQSYSLYAMQKIQCIKPLDPAMPYFTDPDPLGPGD